MFSRPPKAAVGAVDLEGTRCEKCGRGAYEVVSEKTASQQRATSAKDLGKGLGKAFLTGMLTGATKQTERQLGLATTTYRCNACGYTKTV